MTLPGIITGTYTNWQEVTPLPVALTPQAWLQAIPGVLTQLEPHERTALILEALQTADRAGVEVAGCAVDCIEAMIYWK